MKGSKRLENMLRFDKTFVPASVDEGDEFFPNGIFHFNITKMLMFIHAHAEEFVPERVAVRDFPKSFSSINEAYMNSVDSSEPVILAEIAPGRYNLIDGHHRMEKARRSGIEYIMAYRLSVNQHIRFLTSVEAYAAYVDYWNTKLKGRIRHAR